MSHTPGPWWPTEYGVRDVGGYIAHTRSVQHYEGQDERYVREVIEREDNKLLIAAAPELLAALKAINSRLLECSANPVFVNEAYDSFYQEIVNAAINKAEGTTP